MLRIDIMGCNDDFPTDEQMRAIEQFLLNTMGAVAVNYRVSSAESFPPLSTNWTDYPDRLLVTKY